MPGAGGRCDGVREAANPMTAGTVAVRLPLAAVVSLAQAVGKTTVAVVAIARELRLPLFSRDPLMGVLAWAGLRGSGPIDGVRSAVPVIGLALQTQLLEEQLTLGVRAVLECVASPTAKDTWRAVAARCGAPYVGVECVCSDIAVTPGTV